MKIEPIKTEAAYKAALRIVSPMFDNEPAMNTPEGEYFEVMCQLIQEYEEKHYQVSKPV